MCCRTKPPVIKLRTTIRSRGLKDDRLVGKDCLSNCASVCVFSFKFSNAVMDVRCGQF